MIARKINEALELMNELKEQVEKCKEQAEEIEQLAQLVCTQMGTPQFLGNPLFRRTIASML